MQQKVIEQNKKPEISSLYFKLSLKPIPRIQNPKLLIKTKNPPIFHQPHFKNYQQTCNQTPNL